MKPAPRVVLDTNVVLSALLIGEDPDRRFATLRFDERPGNVVQNHDMWPFGLQRLRRNHEHAASDLWHGNLPLPLQPADVAVAQPGVDRKERHVREVGR